MSNLRERLSHLSLSKKLTMNIIGAFLLAIVIIYAAISITDWGVEYYFHDEQKWDARINAKSVEIQKYVTSHNMKLEEISKIKSWSDDNPGLYLSITTSDTELFTSASYGVSYSNLLESDLFFADGTATMTICYFIDYRYYFLIEILDLCVGLIVFLLIVMQRIRRIIREIDQLHEDIDILKSGGFEHEIKVNSNDELGSLQRNLDDMRLALAKNINMEQTLTRANNELVTRMSHDLRTPLTSLLLYLELIDQKKYNDESQLQKYVSVSKAKAEQIKDMSELLFERFLVIGDNENVNSQDAMVRYVLEDSISSLVMTLETHGFTTYTDIQWPDVKIHIIPKYIDRVLDNVYSNLIKYANKDNPVVVSLSLNDENTVLLRFTNYIGARNSAEGSGIGLENIRLMMEKMGGSFIIRENDRQFSAELSFAVVNN